MMSQTVQEPVSQKRPISEQEFLALPDDGRKYELVCGEVQEVPAGVKHDVLALRLGAKLLPNVEPKGYVAGSQAGFRMAGGNLRSPDVSVIFKESLPEGKLPETFGERAPDIAIEIVSPSENLPDLMSKVAEYFQSGAQEVWLLFPEGRVVRRYRDVFTVETLTEEQTLTGEPLLPGFAVQVKELFELG